VEILRKQTKRINNFKSHFRNFEKVDSVRQIFGEKTQETLSNIEVEFTEFTEYMSVDFNGRLLVNPKYLEEGSLIDIYLDVIHELVHVRQVMNGNNCNHALPYVKRPLEIEAYKTSVEAAKALGLHDERIIDYLDSDLINENELSQLATAIGLDNKEDEN
jgi:hypothetical protein